MSDDKPPSRRFSRRSALAALGALALAGARRAARASEARWPDQRQAGAFLCHADFALASQETLLDELAVLQKDLCDALQVSPARELTYVYLFAQGRTHEGYVKRHFPQAPYRRALFIKGRGPGMVFAHLHDDFAIDLRHEATHALLHAALPMVPLWLDEGLAEYFEAPRELRANGSSHLAKIRWEARLGKIRPMNELEQLGQLDEMGAAEYRHAWAWVHCMLHTSAEARAELIAFLADIAAHTPPGQLSDRLRRRIGNPEALVERHFRAWR